MHEDPEHVSPAPETALRREPRPWWQTALKAGVTAALLALLVHWMGGVEQLLRTIASMDPATLALIFVLHTADRFLMTYKWLRVLRCKGIGMPLLAGVRIYCASMVWDVHAHHRGRDAVRIVRSTSGCIPATW